MSTRKKIFWIDDDPKRKRFAEEIGAKFVNASNARLPEEIGDIFDSEQQPFLVVLDQFLTKTKDENPLLQRGSTIAEALKEKWPNCPVVCITAAENLSGKIDNRTRSTYDKLFRSYNFSQYKDEIESIASGFALVTKKATNANDLVSLLKPPKNETDRLLETLPGELRKNFLDASYASNFFRWVGHLFDRPGFLYDDLWAATFMGLSEEGFSKVSNEFEKAKYKGIFVHASARRWWLILLTEVLFQLSEPAPWEMSWHVGRRLSKKFKKTDYSKCYKCKKPFPEIVAYLDSESPERHAMHLACTELHPAYKRQLYFEDIRMMAGD
jgi:hypothetical protein